MHRFKWSDKTGLRVGKIAHGEKARNENPNPTKLQNWKETCWKNQSKELETLTLSTIVVVGDATSA